MVLGATLKGQKYSNNIEWSSGPLLHIVYFAKNLLMVLWSSGPLVQLVIFSGACSMLYMREIDGTRCNLEGAKIF